MTQKKKMSISDVAQALGVSVTTVSFVLNGKAEGRIGPSTIRRVKDYAKKIGYKPNPIAHSHRNKTKVIGILLEDIADPQQSLLASEVERLLKGQGHHTLVVSMNGDARGGEELIRLLQDRDMDGYVLMPFENLEQVLKKLSAANAPVVLYDAVPEGIKVRQVAAEYSAKVTGAIQDYLNVYKNGRIGLVVCPSNMHRMREFQEGYMRAMDKSAGDVLMKKIQLSLEDMEIQGQICDFIRDNRLDAVLFSTNQLARMGVEAIEREHLPVSCVISTYAPLLYKSDTVKYVALRHEVSVIAEDIVKGLL